MAYDTSYGTDCIGTGACDSLVCVWGVAHYTSSGTSVWYVALRATCGMWNVMWHRVHWDRSVWYVALHVRGGIWYVMWNGMNWNRNVGYVALRKKFGMWYVMWNGLKRDRNVWYVLCVWNVACDGILSKKIPNKSPRTVSQLSKSLLGQMLPWTKFHHLLKAQKKVPLKSFCPLTQLAPQT